MGYRSDVKFVFAFPTQRARTAFLAEVTLDTADHDHPEIRELTKDFVLEDYAGERPYVVLVHYEDVKWYPEFPSVKYMDEVCAMATERHSGEWAFCRIGENADDIEQENSDGIYVSDYIEVYTRSEFV